MTVYKELYSARLAVMYIFRRNSSYLSVNVLRKVRLIQKTKNLRQYSTITEEYQSLVAAGKLTHDRHQLEIVKHLNRLQNDLDGYVPPVQRNLFQRVFTSKKNNVTKLKGAYMFGSVGK